MVYPYHDIGYSNNKLRYKLVFVCAHSLRSAFDFRVILLPFECKAMKNYAGIQKCISSDIVFVHRK